MSDMNNFNSTKIFLVTCALPYANGPLHLGHLLEHIQADIWVRYQRMCGHKVFFICASDAHGTPILLRAQKIGIDPETMVIDIGKKHQKVLELFYISYDNYHSTHSQENYQFVLLIYKELRNKGLIKKRILTQMYDPNVKMFLPDRLVKGMCPKCKAPDQYGDNCEVCGSVYSSTDLINARSAITGVQPVLQETEHLFFDLSLYSDMLKKWIRSGSLPESVANKMQEWLSVGLHPWDISRDAPYFGFKIPDTIGKYFYVWLDAPIGYMSTFKNLCNKREDICFEDFWKPDSTVQLCHFIGKDIIYFHSLFWPALLEASGFRKPTSIYVHGFVTFNGTKMSKSRGSLIDATTWLKWFDADSLRYYYATKLSSRIEDIDINLNDFTQRVNADIVNKVVNIAARSASFINQRFSGWLSNRLKDPIVYQRFTEASVSIGSALSNLDFSKALRQIIALADLANRYINEQKPWLIAVSKNGNQDDNLQDICTMGINFYRVLMTYLKPFMPALSQKSEKFLQHKLEWTGIKLPLLNHRISIFESLYQRIKSENINSLLAEIHRQKSKKYNPKNIGVI